MKKLYLLISLALPSISYGQTIYLNDQYDIPIGTATKSGNTTYFKNQYGLPQGTAIQSGNTTYFTNQYGMPQGTATAPIQSTQPPHPIQLMQPSQPYIKW